MIRCCWLVDISIQRREIFIGTIKFYKNDVIRGINVNPFMLDVVFDKYNTATIPVVSTFTMDIVVVVGR